MKLLQIICLCFVPFCLFGQSESYLVIENIEGKDTTYTARTIVISEDSKITIDREKLTKKQLEIWLIDKTELIEQEQEEYEKKAKEIEIKEIAIAEENKKYRKVGVFDGKYLLTIDKQEQEIKIENDKIRGEEIKGRVKYVDKKSFFVFGLTDKKILFEEATKGTFSAKEDKTVMLVRL